MRLTFMKCSFNKNRWIESSWSIIVLSLKKQVLRKTNWVIITSMTPERSNCLSVQKSMMRKLQRGIQQRKMTKMKKNKIVKIFPILTHPFPNPYQFLATNLKTSFQEFKVNRYLWIYRVLALILLKSSTIRLSKWHTQNKI